MKPLVLLSLFLSTIALADVGPRPPPCDVPADCVTCEGHGVDSDPVCRADALGKGLMRSDCTDRRGAAYFEHYCPPGTTAARVTPLRVGAVLAALLLLIGAPVLLWRSRRRR